MVYMNRIEYRREHALDDNELDDLGYEGWELVAIDNGVYVFKRGYFLPPPPSPAFKPEIPEFLQGVERPKDATSTSGGDPTKIPAHLLERVRVAREGAVRTAEEEAARKAESRENLPA